MKISIILLTLSLLIPLQGCGQANNSTHTRVHTHLSQIIRERNFAPPRDWKQVKSCGVTFYLPSDFREKKVQAANSCPGQFQGDYTSLNLEVLGISLDENESRRSEYADKPECELKSLLIDGQKAEVITCSDADSLNNLTILFVPNMGKGRGSLIIRSYNRGTRSLYISRMIFETVKFAD
jgi:hypothetical protein